MLETTKLVIKWLDVYLTVQTVDYWSYSGSSACSLLVGAAGTFGLNLANHVAYHVLLAYTPPPGASVCSASTCRVRWGRLLAGERSLSHVQIVSRTSSFLLIIK